MFTLNPLYFLISLCIGMFIAYIATPTPEIIIKYPTPDNAGKVVYRDNADSCYKYSATEVKCSGNEIEQKIQYVDIDKKQKEGIFYSKL